VKENRNVLDLPPGLSANPSASTIDTILSDCFERVRRLEEARGKEIPDVELAPVLGTSADLLHALRGGLRPKKMHPERLAVFRDFQNMPPEPPAPTRQDEARLAHITALHQPHPKDLAPLKFMGPR
jgi:hypothetical protein